MRLERVCRSAAIYRNLLLLGIGFAVIGAAYGQPVTWMRTSSGGDNCKAQSLTFHAAGTAAAATVTVNPAQTYQTMMGFGGSFTDAGAYDLNFLSATDRAAVIADYFGPSGANYQVCRSQMGASDFSQSLYSYDDVSGDNSLTNFSINHDLTMIVRWEKEAIALNPNLKIFGSPWSAPAWMKSNNNMDNGGTLNSSANAAWALYFVKYVQAYKAQGIPIWGVTIQNEPAATQTWPSMIFSDVTERDFLVNSLGPTLANNSLGPTALAVMFLDHNRDMMVQWASTFYGNATAKAMVWGEAIHWYDNQSLFSAVQSVYNSYPGKNILATEQCITGFDPSNASSYSWTNTAEKSATDIIGDVTSGSTGWVDWNMILSSTGGPNLSSNWCYAGVLINTSAKTYQLTSLYYYMTQFSKYVKTGAVRIGCTATGSSVPTVMAFKNPDSSIVAIVHNGANSSYTGRVVFGTNQVEFSTTPYSVEDFYWAPTTPVAGNTVTVKQSTVNTAPAGRVVLGLTKSLKQQQIPGVSRYTLTGERISTGNAVLSGLYIEKPNSATETR
jgi:glucosylceramidase